MNRQRVDHSFLEVFRVFSVCRDEYLGLYLIL